jgi:hypothetical protein
MKTSATLHSISLFLAIIMYPSISMAQSIVVDDKSNDIKPTIETRNVDSSQISINSQVEIAPEAISVEISNKEVTPGLSVFEGLEPRDMRSDEYIASVDLGRLILPGDGFDGVNNPVGRVMLGLKRPYYRLGKDMRLAGFLDLKVARSLAGLGNSATITFRYDFHRIHDEGSVRMSMSFVHISYKISIPFGRRTETQRR